MNLQHTISLGKIEKHADRSHSQNGAGHVSHILNTAAKSTLDELYIAIGCNSCGGCHLQHVGHRAARRCTD